MRDVEKDPAVASALELPPIQPEWVAAHSLHYQLLANQQLMLEDVHRTAKYHAGIAHNACDFAGKVVLDVGAGTGILSLFAAQAGAKKVYAVEGTSAANYANDLIQHAGLADRIEVLRGRLDEVRLDGKVDVIISEPWGFFLFHERMIEVFLSARDRFLLEGGKLFPSTAKVWVAPFRDLDLYEWRCEKVAFWERSDFFGIDLSALADTARFELFAMPAVGPVDPRSLLAEPVGIELDFARVQLGDLAVIHLPFDFTVNDAGWVHGLAGWFDVSFAGSNGTVTLSTAPDAPTTHWTQLRFLFADPIELEVGQRLSGRITLTANAQSSYDASIEFATAEGRSYHQQYRLHTYFSSQNDD